MKYRHKYLSGEMLERMKEIFASVLRKWGAELVEFGGEADQVYLLFETTLTSKLSDLIKNLKSVSARHMRKVFATELAPFSQFWNHAYALISVGGRSSIETLLKYIENQDDPRKLG